jgi:PAS domain S-box-containing protein
MDGLHHETTGDIEGLWDWDLVTGRAHFSPRWFALLGYDCDSAATSLDEWLDRVHPDDITQVRREIESLQGPGADRLEFKHRVRHHDGTYRWMKCRAAALRNERGEATRLTGAHLDITVGVVMDPVTRLPNRQRLLEQIGQAIEHNRRQPALLYSVAVLELGRASNGADKKPPTADSALLQAVARRLETCLRLAVPLLRGPRRDMLASLDGDRFAFLVEGLTEISQAKHVADRALSTLLEPFDVRGTQLFLTPSAGVAVSPSGYDRAEDVLRDAESALHRARLLGGSHCEVFDDACLDAEAAGSRLEQDLTDALARNEFHVVYQPIVSVATERIVGVEALVRWQHPALGLVSPADFIPVAEKSGAVVPLGRWILRQACRQLSAWRVAMPRASALWVSVNLSTRELRDPGLVSDIGQVLLETGLDASALALELTEGLAMENPDAVKSVLMQLRAMGIRISIDDFGSGYSSLGYLRQLPVDTLKIDRSLVVGIERNAETTALINTVVAMAQQLNLNVVAEGVENESQLERLRSLRCGFVQGFLFAKPLDAQAVGELLEQGFEPRGDGHAAGNQAEAGSTMSAWRRARLVAAATLVVSLAAAAGIRRGEQGHAPSTDAVDPVAIVATTALAPMAPTVPPSPPIAPATQPAPPAPATRTPSPAPTPSTTSFPTRATSRPAPVNVLHDHVFGSCRGRLSLSSGRLVYTPDEKGSKDAFEFDVGTFTSALEDRTLRIRSASKTYHFRPRANSDAPALRTLASAFAEAGR